MQKNYFIAKRKLFWGYIYVIINTSFHSTTTFNALMPKKAAHGLLNIVFSTLASYNKEGTIHNQMLFK